MTDKRQRKANLKRGKRTDRHPTIVDIAELAGVAPMTVSRVINETGYVSEAMREKVQQAVKELNYHPNGLARSLKRQRTQVIGILLPDITNPFSAQLVSGIQDILLARGYASFICTSERSTEREQAGLSALFDHRVDGIIVATRETPTGNEWLSKLVERNLPIVLVGREFPHPLVDRVTADHQSGGYEATKYLISTGHKRIGFVGVSPATGQGLRRFQGYLTALRNHRLPVEDGLIVGPETISGPGYSTQNDGYQGMKRLLSLSKPPTAVFARNDFTAIGAMCALHDEGLAVPDDVSIVGFDNVPLAAYTSPPLTTVDQPTVEQGRQAASLLLERIEGKLRERKEINLNCHLIIRHSTGQKKAARR
ncbi:MAG: LacI family DNA-binding transcriptional regulator [Acidobacteria bacterium]|nr:LacI family DNA-binding transcriptional regulator [Acidobacteriota bacterium]